MERDVKMDRIITHLLRRAITDIENLQEYYSSQIEYVHMYVKNNIEKYKYGVLLDRFFLNKVFETHETVIEDIERRVIDDLIAEYHIDDKEEKKIVKYKLNPEKDFSAYEMDPQVASTNFYKLIQQPNILNESMIVMLLVKYEDAIADIYRYLLEEFPEAYLSDKSITYSELVSFDTDLDEIKERFISKEIDEFMRLPLSDWYKSFEKNQKANFFFDNNVFDQFKEVYYRRNLVVHNQGIVNEIYKNSIPMCTVELGERLYVNEEYLSQAFLLARKMLIGTVWGLRKTAKDIEELNSYLFDYGYSCLKNEEWDLAKYIYSMLLTEDNQLVSDKMCERVNLWIALKNLIGVDAIEKEVRELDVSAMKTQFSVAKHALLDEFDAISTLLEGVIESELPVWCVKDWPLFNQYRESEEYKLFVEKNKDLFDIKGYESSNETIGDSEDVIMELGKDIDVKLTLA